MVGTARRVVARAAVLGPVVAVLLTLSVGVVAPAAAAPPPLGSDFYVPPPVLPAGTPGDIIRTEPMQLALSVPGAHGPLPAHATRIMYRSTDIHGAPVAVSGSYLDPALPWNGPGARPLVSLAVGTHGQGDQCAPSHLLEQLVQYNPPFEIMTEIEAIGINSLLLRGIAVVITDYQGLGTPAMHDYLNTDAEARTVLDAARAAQRLPGTAITNAGPVGLFGYSQGGGAAAAAVEQQPDYAPELDLRGAFLGAAVDVLAALESIDTTIAKGYAGWLLNGLAAAYPEARPEIDRILSPAGRALLNDTAKMCLVEGVARYGLIPSSSVWTASGRPLPVEVAANPVLRRILDSLIVGNRTPTAPVLMISAPDDEIVPNATVRTASAKWCSRGVPVQLDEPPIPRIAPPTAIVHATGTLSVIAGAEWMTQRFAGVPPPSNCPVTKGSR